MPRNPLDRCDVSWEDRVGTTASGNLPQYKVGVCIEDAVDIVSVQTEFPWVDIRDFHFYHIKCPYATESNWHFVTDNDITSLTYWQAIDVSGEAVPHTATSGIMIRDVMGSKHGWSCVDPACPYYLGTAIGSHKGVRYFYR